MMLSDPRRVRDDGPELGTGAGYGCDAGGEGEITGDGPVNAVELVGGCADMAAGGKGEGAAAIRENSGRMWDADVDCVPGRGDGGWRRAIPMTPCCLAGRV